MVYEARDGVRYASFEDQRMWRLLLARLHPDVGGDHELFAFACAVREEVSKGRHPANDNESERDQGKDNAAPFLRTWHEAMGRWSSSNRATLDSFRAR